MVSGGQPLCGRIPPTHCPGQCSGLHCGGAALQPSHLQHPPLFLCLPELWQRVEADDLLALLGRMESGMTCFNYLAFVHLYLEGNLLPEALQPAGKRFDLASLKQLLASSQAGQLFDREVALNDLLGGPEASYLRFDPMEWCDTTQRLMCDPRLKPVPTSQQGAAYLAILMALA